MNRFVAKVLTLCVLVIGVPLKSFGQNYSREDYINKYGELAVKEMKRVGIPASITLAQGMLESENGNSNLAKKSNNHFGIKCHNDWNGKKVHHDDDKKGECFRKYQSVYDSYLDHSEFLTGKQRYASLFELKTTDYKGWAHGLKKAGYATDPRYAKKLIDIIEENDLHRFDKGVVVVRSKKQSASPTAPVKGVSSEANDNFVLNAFASHKIDLNNGVKYITVQEDDNFLDICSEFGLREWEIYAYNDLEKSANIKEYKYLYVQSKKNKAHYKHKIHKVKQDESLHYLSQKYGVKLKRLEKLNGLDDNSKLSEGQIIQLRKKKK